jgi:hypothetical protein
VNVAHHGSIIDPDLIAAPTHLDIEYLVVFRQSRMGRSARVRFASLAHVG